MEPETTPNVTSEGQDGPTGGQADDVVADPVETPPETPEAAAPSPEPAAPAPTPEPLKPAAEATKAPQGKAQARLAELEQQFDADDFDPYSREGKAVVKEIAKLSGVVASEYANEQATWQAEAEEYELPVKTLKSEWKAAKDSLPAHLQTQEGIEVAYRARLAAKKEPPTPAPAKPKAAKPTPVISPGQVLPRGAGSVPPQPPTPDERTIEQRVIDGDKDLLKQFREATEAHFAGRR